MIEALGVKHVQNPTTQVVYIDGNKDIVIREIASDKFMNFCDLFRPVSAMLHLKLRHRCPREL